MKTYRNILKTKLMEKGLTQRQIASVMGWAGNSAVSLVLSGGRDFGEGELRKMCEIAGISILWLAANSDDLVIADHKESVDIASISDQLSPEARQALLLLAKQMLNTM
jgi:transcriptional regulator with XRE-family HTH domain